MALTCCGCCALQEDGEELDLLQQAIQVTDAVSRGNEGHLAMTAIAARRTRQLMGAESSAARLMQLACINTHRARYGQVQGSLLSSLIEVWSGAATASRLGQRLGVLALDANANKSDDR